MPNAWARSVTEATAVASPEITVFDGPFAAAMLTSSTPCISGSTASSGAINATMEPPSGSPPIRRPRSATMRNASAKGITPAT